MGTNALLGGIITGGTLYGLGARERRVTAEKAARALQSRVRVGPSGLMVRF